MTSALSGTTENALYAELGIRVIYQWMVALDIMPEFLALYGVLQEMCRPNQADLN
jgi:hypothetical protein